MILGFALGVLLYEAYLLATATPGVWMEDGEAIFVGKHHQGLVVGEKPWFEDFVKGKAGTLFRTPEIRNWESLAVGNQYQYGDLSVIKWSDWVGLIDLGGSRFLILLEAVEDWGELLGQAVDTEADFWVLWKNDYPKILPPPRKGIFLLNDGVRKPAMLEMARQHQLPFVWIKETGEIELRKGVAWNIYTNK